MIDIDLRDNPDAMPCGLNLSQACCESTLLLGVFNSIPDAVPTNTGSFRRVRMHLKENTVCGIPRHPTSCSVATTNLADRVGNAGEPGDRGPRRRLRHGEHWLDHSALARRHLRPQRGKPRAPTSTRSSWAGAAGAASAQADAWISIGHLGNAGMSYQDSIELDEMRFPLTVRGRHFLTDFRGATAARGAAPGFIASSARPRATWKSAYVSDGNVTPPEGARGGTAGRAGQPVPA